MNISKRSLTRVTVCHLSVRDHLWVMHFAECRSYLMLGLQVLCWLKYMSLRRFGKGRKIRWKQKAESMLLNGRGGVCVCVCVFVCVCVCVTICKMAACEVPTLIMQTACKMLLTKNCYPKHNLLVIGGDMNAQIRKSRNNKYSVHNTSNRNGQHLIDFMIENRLTCLNTNFQKREGKLWTYTYTNNSKAQIDYVFINRKWKNSAMNCKAYSSFEGVSSDHRIVTAKVRLSLRKNATRTATTKHNDWALLNNRDIRDKYALELRNRFETLQEKTEKGIPNDEYEILLKHTLRQHQSVSQQNLELNIESLGKRQLLEKNMHSWKLPPKAIRRTQQTQMPKN